MAKLSIIDNDNYRYINTNGDPFMYRMAYFKDESQAVLNSERPRNWDTSLSSKSQIWTKFFSQPPVTLKTPLPKKKFAQQNFARACPQIS
jgi:hypothetical protein